MYKLSEEREQSTSSETTFIPNVYGVIQVIGHWLAPQEMFYVVVCEYMVVYLIDIFCDWLALFHP